MTPEQAAEEYSKERLRHQVDEIALIQAFLAGHSHALTPRKIDPNDESTWPPREANYHLLLSNLGTASLWQIWGDSVELWVDIQRGEFTHWLPLPPTPQGER